MNFFLVFLGVLFFIVWHYLSAHIKKSRARKSRKLWEFCSRFFPFATFSARDFLGLWCYLYQCALQPTSSFKRKVFSSSFTESSRIQSIGVLFVIKCSFITRQFFALLECFYMKSLVYLLCWFEHFKRECILFGCNLSYYGFFTVIVLFAGWRDERFVCGMAGFQIYAGRRG